MDRTSKKSPRFKPLDSECKRILYNVIKFCDKEALEGKVMVPLSQSVKRASRITGVSESSVKRRRRELFQLEDSPDFDSPDEERQEKCTVEKRRPNKDGNHPDFVPNKCLLGKESDPTNLHPKRYIAIAKKPTSSILRMVLEPIGHREDATKGPPLTDKEKVLQLEKQVKVLMETIQHMDRQIQAYKAERVALKNTLQYFYSAAYSGEKKSSQNDVHADEDISANLEVSLTTPEDGSSTSQDAELESPVIKKEPVSDVEEEDISYTSRPSTSGFTFSVASLREKSSTSQGADLKPSIAPAVPSEIIGYPPLGDDLVVPSSSDTNVVKNEQLDATDPSHDSRSLQDASASGTAQESKLKARDQFDVYGEYIASKLRKLDWKSCAYVQKAIGDLIFEAEMGKFKNGS